MLSFTASHPTVCFNNYTSFLHLFTPCRRWSIASISTTGITKNKLINVEVCGKENDTTQMQDHIFNGHAHMPVIFFSQLKILTTGLFPIWDVGAWAAMRGLWSCPSALHVCLEQEDTINWIIKIRYPQKSLLCASTVERCHRKHF